MFIIRNRQFYSVVNFIVAFYLISSLQCDESSNRSKDKIILSPVELIDLITQEERQMKQPQIPSTLVYKFDKKTTEITTTSTASSQPSNEDSTTTKTLINENAQSVDMWDSNNHINSMWAYQTLNPAKVKPYDQLAAAEEIHAHHRSVFRSTQSLTRLAKTLSLGFDPYFNKGYFEPFETRPKPVTLIGIRKNGLLPRKTIYMAGANKPSDLEVAELQSPYNEVSSFWLNQPGLN